MYFSTRDLGLRGDNESYVAKNWCLCHSWWSIDVVWLYTNPGSFWASLEQEVAIVAIRNSLETNGDAPAAPPDIRTAVPCDCRSMGWLPAAAAYYRHLQWPLVSVCMPICCGGAPMTPLNWLMSLPGDFPLTTLGKVAKAATKNPSVVTSDNEQTAVRCGSSSAQKAVASNSCLVGHWGKWHHTFKGREQDGDLLMPSPTELFRHSLLSTKASIHPNQRVLSSPIWNLGWPPEGMIGTRDGKVFLQPMSIPLAVAVGLHCQGAESSLRRGESLP